MLYMIMKIMGENVVNCHENPNCSYGHRFHFFNKLNIISFFDVTSS